MSVSLPRLGGSPVRLNTMRPKFGSEASQPGGNPPASPLSERYARLLEKELERDPNKLVARLSEFLAEGSLGNVIQAVKLEKVLRPGKLPVTPSMLKAIIATAMQKVPEIERDLNREVNEAGKPIPPSWPDLLTQTYVPAMLQLARERNTPNVPTDPESREAKVFASKETERILAEAQEEMNEMRDMELSDTGAVSFFVSIPATTILQAIEDDRERRR